MANKRVVRGPDGKPIQGFPFAKDLAAIYEALKKGNIAENRARHLQGDLERILGDEITHQGNSQTLGLANHLKDQLTSSVTFPEITLTETSLAKGPVPSGYSSEPQPKTVKDALNNAYEAPRRLGEGTVLKIGRVDNPRPGKSDYSMRVSGGGRVFFPGGKRPNVGGFCRITRDSNSSFYNAQIISDEEAADALNVDTTGLSAERGSGNNRKPTGHQALEQRFRTYTTELNSYAEVLDETLAFIKRAEVEDSQARDAYERSIRRFNAEKSKHSEAIIGSGLALLAERGDVRNAYEDATTRAKKLEESVTHSLNLLKEQAISYEEKGARRNYDVKLPEKEKQGEPEPSDASRNTAEEKADTVLRQYQLTLRLGKRTTSMIFTDSNLPRTGRDMDAYLRDPNNFPERRDRELVSSIVSMQKDGATILYNGTRLGPNDPVRDVFEDYKSQITLEEGKKVKREAKRSEVRPSRGGGLGFYKRGL